MKKVAFISSFLFIFLMISCQPSGENKVIFTLHDDNPNSSYLISIAEPLDGAYNRNVATFEQAITNSNKVEFIYKKRYPAVIPVGVAGRRFNVIMHPNTMVYVDIYPQIETNDWVVFRGDNAAGHQWYGSKTLGERGSEIDEIFRNNKKDFPVLISRIEATLYPIDSLEALKEISGSFAKVLKKERLAQSYWSVVNDYLVELDKKSCTTVDSIAIRSNLEKIFSVFPPLAPDILAYSYGGTYLDTYAIAVYDGIDLLSDKRYIPEFGSSCGKSVLLPHNFQKAILGHCIIDEYLNNGDDFNKIEATNYFRKKYPDSEYLPIIDSMAERYKQFQENFSKEETQAEAVTSTKENVALRGKVTKLAEGIYIDTSAVANSIHSLRELHETYFKGKRIFVDLWATWCAPCIMEFTYKEQLDSLLKLHNITSVFISVDIPQEMKHWLQFIDSKRLTGYHFLSNDALITDIRRISGYPNPKSSMPIPHYIYMDEQGNIIEKNAPRPSETEKLADLFRKK